MSGPGNLYDTTDAWAIIDVHVISQHSLSHVHLASKKSSFVPNCNVTSQLTGIFTTMVHARDKESTNLTDQGVAALGEGMVSVLFNTQTTDESIVVRDLSVMCIVGF